MSMRGQCGGSLSLEAGRRLLGHGWVEGGALSDGFALLVLTALSGARGHHFAQLRVEQVEDETVQAAALHGPRG